MNKIFGLSLNSKYLIYLLATNLSAKTCPNWLTAEIFVLIESQSAQAMKVKLLLFVTT